MRNLKRALSLALASVMLMGMMVVGSSAASYPDVDSADNVEAIAVLKAVGVMTGDANGNFNPDQKVTRNEMAVVMANLLSLRVADFIGTATSFTDVPAWAQRYVAACFADGIISGYSETWFGGEDSVTAAQAGLMLMKALGYFQFAPDFGNNWQVETIRQASKINLFDGINVGAETALTRNELATLVLNALKADMVDYSGDRGTNITMPDGSSIVTGYTIKYDPIVRAGESTDNYAGSAPTDDGINVLQLCERLYGNDLKKNANLNTDAFGRPGYTWTYETKDVHFAKKTPVATFTAATKPADVAKALSGYSVAVVDSSGATQGNKKVNNTTDMTSGHKLTGILYANSSTGTDLTFASETVAKAIADETANGQLVEIYANSNSVITDIVKVTYTMAKVNNVTTTKDRTTYTFSNSVPTGIDYLDDATDDTIEIVGSIAKGDYVTAVKPTGSTVLYVYATDEVTGTQTAKTNDGKITVDGTQYTIASGVTSAGSTFNNSDKAAVYYIDQYGFVVETTSTAAASDYAFVIGVSGKLSTTVDGSTPSVEARVLLMDGTVGVYDVEVEKLKTGNTLIGQDASNGDLNGTITLEAGDYVIKGTKICVYDASFGTAGASNTAGTVGTAAAKLVSNTYGYSISGKEIELESLTALAASSNAVDTVYAASMGDAVKHDKTSYTSVKYDGSSTSNVTLLADKNTKFVVYNADKKTATVYTGATSLPKSISDLNSSAGGTGYAVLKTSTGAGTLGTASVIFVYTATGVSADATEDYVYIDHTKFSETLVNGDTKYIYTGTYADGSTITLAPSEKLNNSGLYTYDSNNEVTDNLLTGGQYVNSETSLTVTGDLLGVGSNYYNITDETQIVYIDGDLGEVNGNKGFVVLTVKDGTATSDVEAIFVTSAP